MCITSVMIHSDKSSTMFYNISKKHHPIKCDIKGLYTYEDNGYVYVCENNFLSYKELGHFGDCNDLNTYQQRLRKIIDKYTKEVINDKLRKRLLKSKFDKFNNLIY